MNVPNAARILPRIDIVLQRVLALRHDDRHRRSELVGDIRGEALFFFKGILKSRKHQVKAVRQLMQLVFSGFQLDSFFQIVSLGDGRDRGRYLLNRTERPLRNHASSEYGKEADERQHGERKSRDIRELFLALGLRNHAPQPEPLKPRGAELPVIDIITDSLHLHGV